METVILGLRTFSRVEQEVLRKYVQLEPICVNTLKTHMANLTRRVEEKICKELPKVIALIFDMWSCSDTH